MSEPAEFSCETAPDPLLTPKNAAMAVSDSGKVTFLFIPVTENNGAVLDRCGCLARHGGVSGEVMPASVQVEVTLTARG